jgi:hypothetical protein
MTISMETTHIAAKTGPDLSGLFAGFRFRVCETDDDARRSLDIRRRVYVEEKGLSVAVPDRYDEHSWLLLAEEVRTGRAVATMRVTSRAAGPLECEHSFVLPASLRSPDVVEASRFAILPEFRRDKNGSPAVSVGLFKTVALFVERVVGAKRWVLCSKAERVHTYTFLHFRQTGVRAPYTALDGTMHEILVQDLRHGYEPYRGDFAMWDFFFAQDSPEISVPVVPPPLGLGTAVTAPFRAIA